MTGQSKTSKEPPIMAGTIHGIMLCKCWCLCPSSTHIADTLSRVVQSLCISDIPCRSFWKVIEISKRARPTSGRSPGELWQRVPYACEIMSPHIFMVIWILRDILQRLPRGDSVGNEIFRNNPYQVSWRHLNGHLLQRYLSFAADFLMWEARWKL